MRPHARSINPGSGRRKPIQGLPASLLFLASLSAGAVELPGLTVIGVDANGGETVLTSYRWQVEEDKTYHVQTLPGGAADPTTFDPTWDQGNDAHPGGETLSVGFHRSYVPVLAKGCVGMPAAAACNDLAFADPDGAVENHYYVSVVPLSGYSIGGAAFKDGDAGVTVYVNQLPLETAQITVLLFEDRAPINNAPDLPTEDPTYDGDGDGIPDHPMAGFQIILEDAGGRYGASAGVQSQDAFGNPLGTTYDAAGEVTGFQPLVTGPDGRLTIRNLAPGKYGISAVPPAGQGWQQTSTIEGTKVIDAWVKPGEPPFFAELGPPGFHVTIGFVQAFNDIPVGTGTAISGTVVNQHMSRPPDYAFYFYDGTCFGHTTPWVGLNDLAGGGIGTGIYAAPTDEDCNFTIPDVPDGSYQLSVWDSNLDLIFAFYGLTIENGSCSTPSGSCNLGEVPVFQWFHRQEHRVFDDTDGDGTWAGTEAPGAPETAFNLRFRDGSLYQTNVSDGTGAYSFDQVFPFFSWLVAEVDFARFQATGLQVVVDAGGAIPGTGGQDPPLDGLDWTFGQVLAPQDQRNPTDPVCDGDPTICEETGTYRIEHGPVLTQGFQGFLGQTNAFLWGKRHYPDGENGGITGIVYYAVTRAENDPQQAAAEPWEPGIPGVTVNLYDLGEDGLPNTDDDVLRNTTVTDSWDASIPTGCKWGNGGGGPFMFSPDGVSLYEQDCWDGLRMFNQARPAVFDGGYAFDRICGHRAGYRPDRPTPCPPGQWVSPMPVGDYVVEVIPPPGYEVVKPEDKNVDFGDSYEPAPVPTLLPPACVGDLHTVPLLLTLFPLDGVPAPFAGTDRPLCDKKQVTLTAGANPAADFFLFTEVPPAAHGFGSILDDTQNEFDPNSPNFGEKYAPPFVPIAIRDFTGRVIGKTLSDQYGRYNFLVPSTVTANLPQPSGMSPNMLTACMNDPGDDPSNPDPNWNQQYSTFCYTLQYMPGVTTYLDTPVVPVAAFTGPDQFPLDCEYPDGTPRVYSADVPSNGVGGGPYRPAGGAWALVLTSMGPRQVPNPSYCNPAAGTCPAGTDTVNKLVTRDYGFGTSPGSVTLGGIPIACPGWSDQQVDCTLPAGMSHGAHQLVVTRANGESTKAGVTVQVGLRPGSSVQTVMPGGSIQAAIDAAGKNDLILVAPGQYNEMVVMWKPVQLQGWGEGSTTINALKAPASKLQTWRELVDGLIANGDVDLVPGQEAGAGTPEPVTLFTEEGAGVLVLAKSQGADAFGTGPNRDARVDGFTIRSADTGGGIVANGYAHYLQVSNNRIANNNGFYGGGIRVGHPLQTVVLDGGGLAYSDADNDHVSVHHNQVVFNGALGGAGGGISVCTGSDQYQVTGNWVCGNFAAADGGGIGHTGLSNNGLIAGNTVLFNESFLQGQTVSGGGIFVGGAPPLAVGGLTPGAGDVQVSGNLVQGNSAGAGDGGGIRLAGINGQDVADNPVNNSPSWYSVGLFNNMIVDNVAGLAGGGISLQDALSVRIVHNTVADNDSLATAGEAFAPGSPNQSTPQPGAGLVSRGHSAALAGLLSGIPGAPGFSNPSAFADNILWHNRQLFFWVDASSGCVPGDPSCVSTYGLCPDPTGNLACPGGNTVVYDDLAVIPASVGVLSCPVCLFSDDPDPMFVAEYVNGARAAVAQPEITTAIQTPVAFDEGGNFIRAAFGPLSRYDDPVPGDGDPGSLFGDYHVQLGPAIDAGIDLSGMYPTLATDFDGDARPQGAAVDIGADEAQ